jgi:bifunctional ADP-heptose synthase (sugar kinase/adenylyltransferase)
MGTGPPGDLEEVDVFLPNETELRGITGCKDPSAGLRALKDVGATVVAKLGASGSMVLQNGRPLRVPSFRVAAIDTTGAGDSFNAGFLHAWLRKATLVDALRWGAACAALAKLGYGGTTSQPRGNEVEFVPASRHRLSTGLTTHHQGALPHHLMERQVKMERQLKTVSFVIFLLTSFRNNVTILRRQNIGRRKRERCKGGFWRSKRIRS